MKIIRLTLINLRRLIKNPTLCVMGFVIPLIVVFMMGGGYKESGANILLVDSDKTPYSQIFIDEIIKNGDNVNIKDGNTFERDKVKLEEFDAIITIEEGYQKNIKNKKVPVVTIENFAGLRKILKVSNSATTKLLEKEILGAPLENNILVEKIKKDIVPTGIISLLMIAYYGFMSAAMIIEDLVKLKKENVLKRLVTTPNKSYEVLTGNFLACFIFLAASMSLAYTVVKDSEMLKGVVPLNGYIAIILASFVFIAVTIFMVRWFKRADIIGVVVTFSGLGLFMIGTLGVMRPYLPDSMADLARISYISPFYWIGEIANGNIISGSVVLILMGVAIFTTGTYRLNKFAIDA
ncbi:MAG: ABC transporter permease [Sarcina sp.]